MGRHRWDSKCACGVVYRRCRATPRADLQRARPCCRPSQRESSFPSNVYLQGIPADGICRSNYSRYPATGCRTIHTPEHQRLRQLRLRRVGFGGDSLDGLTANVYGLALSKTFSDLPYDGWSVKLLMPIQFGVYSFKANFAGQDISVSQQSLSLVPGAERSATTSP